MIFRPGVLRADYRALPAGRAGDVPEHLQSLELDKVAAMENRSALRRMTDKLEQRAQRNERTAAHLRRIAATLDGHDRRLLLKVANDYKPGGNPEEQTNDTQV